MVVWALLVGGEASGANRHVDHDAIFEGGTGPLVALCLFLSGWALMIVAMMVPVTLWALGRSPAEAAPPGFLGTFLVGFVSVWVLAGSAALGFDLVLHQVVDRVSELEARPWVVSAALLAAAGAVQLAPSTRRSLARCGHVTPPRRGDAGSSFAVGRDHGRMCLRADGPLMLVMFAAGGGLGWMVVLTAVMAAERSSRFGHRVAAAAGIALLAGAGLIVLTPVWFQAPFGTL